MMNELEFRKRCIINPDDTDAAYQQALGESADYQRMYDDCVAFNSKLSRAASIEAPQELNARIIDAVSGSNREISTGGSGHTGFFSKPKIAAVMSLAATIIFFFSLFLRPQVALSDMIIEHLYDDMEAMHSRTVVSSQQLEKIGRFFNAEIKAGALGIIHFADACDIDKHKGLHIVYDGVSGPVTVFYVPGAEVERLRAIGKNEFHGMIFPYPDGTVAVFGLMGEDLMDHKQRIEKGLIIQTGRNDRLALL